jgi:anti-sigma regulatory factor (Ser/Thr protein kinase)
MDDVQKKIQEFLSDHKRFTSSELVRVLKVSRQSVAKHLKKMVREGKISKTGSTRSAVYSSKPTQPIETTIALVKKTKNLQEDLVFEEINLRLGLRKKINANALTISNFSFCEMLNNAIDHSQSNSVKICVSVDSDNLTFDIQDAGVGIFFNVQKKFALQSEHEALAHVMKGKQTTDPERHSGQGIFFTSKIADQLRFQSHQIEVAFDNQKKDVFVKQIRKIRGTRVFFKISKNTKKKIKKLFDQYTNQDYEFDKSKVTVHLSKEEEFLSRSQARRLLIGLEKYKRIVFDFKGVKSVGQAFADEIFRVFQSLHPEVQLAWINTNETVSFMIGYSIKKS